MDLIEGYGPDVLAAFDDGGVIATGFNDAVTWLSSGFDDFVHVLTDAGIVALALSDLLLGRFSLTNEDVAAVLIDAAYELEEIAKAVGERVFGAARPVATFFPGPRL